MMFVFQMKTVQEGLVLNLSIIKSGDMCNVVFFTSLRESGRTSIIAIYLGYVWHILRPPNIRGEWKHSAEGCMWGTVAFTEGRREGRNRDDVK